jgi:adenosine deaminase
MRATTAFELAKKLKLDLPTDSFENFRKVVLIEEPMTDLKTVLSKFLVAQKLLESSEIIERLAFEATEDAYNNGIRLVEFRYSPSFISSGHPKLSFDDIHQSILSGVNKAKKIYPIGVGLIGTMGRIDPMPLASSVCDFIINNRDTFVGVDLADSEVGFDCKPFAKLFQRAKAAGLNVTVHAGEPDYPGAIDAILDSVHLLGAQRIGHGIQCHKSPEALKVLADNKIPLEVCPTSNYLTNSVTSVKNHPLRKIMDAGVRVTINSDDPGIFNYDLTHEYEALKRDLGFTEKEFAQANEWALEASFLNEAEKSFWYSRN